MLKIFDQTTKLNDKSQWSSFKWMSSSDTHLLQSDAHVSTIVVISHWFYMSRNGNGNTNPTQC